MMHACYSIMGFTYELNLSTRPKKAMGSKELWDNAEQMMKDALDMFGRPWKINPGDGAFYGPKVRRRQRAHHWCCPPTACSCFALAVVLWASGWVASPACLLV